MRLVLSFALLALAACAEQTVIAKSTSCPTGPNTYLGFHGLGPPPPKLWHEIKTRFPDAIIVQVSDGVLGVIIGEHTGTDWRARQDAAAAAVGWKGDIVDFPIVTSDCGMSFMTPVPLPPPEPR